MAAVGVFGRAHELEFNALEGSLNMMSKVLNDVLDFNRMDSGRFESVSKPYAFHNAFDAIFMPLRLATDSRGLQLVTDLDPEIDRVARRAAYQSIGSSPDEIARKLTEHPDEPGVVVGDEMRLRQIITNLASNATKFTPSGGTVSISTRLLWPRPSSHQDDSETAVSPSVAGGELGTTPTVVTPARALNGDTLLGSPTAGARPSVEEAEKRRGLSAKSLEEHNEAHALPVDKIIVRIEVSDTGCGIQSRDMVHNKLFCE
jgi:osomolarity two-component system, sensor histidine kinase SLN1